MIYFFFSPAEVSESTQYIARQLMLAQEIRKFPDHKALILIQGEEAIYADKIPWYKNKYLTSLQQGKITITSIMPIVQNIFKRASLISEQLQEKKPIGKEIINFQQKTSDGYLKKNNIANPT